MRRFAFLSAVFAVIVSGCSGAPTYNWTAERSMGYRVGPADVLRINVWKHEELSQQNIVVRPDGGFSLPLVGDIQAAGRNADEIAAEITTRLEKYYQDKPPVTVQVSEVRSYKIYVVGEVNRGGEFMPNHEISVLQGMALAGGFTRFANPDRVIIVRKDARGERRIPFDFSAVVERGEMAQNLLLQTGDTVIVP
ncbi:MAG: polysaccharide biosynthesis/export family protein [Polyangiaceae bacterium]